MSNIQNEYGTFIRKDGEWVKVQEEPIIYRAKKGTIVKSKKKVFKVMPENPMYSVMSHYGNN